MASETNVVSFVLRFVCDDSADRASLPGRCGAWHGVVRHVQTNEELHFARWAEAEAFIRRHVSLDDPECSIIFFV